MKNKYSFAMAIYLTVVILLLLVFQGCGKQMEQQEESLTVLVLSPVSGSTVSGHVPVRVGITGHGNVDRVEFMIDGLLVHTDTQQPWEYTWDTKGIQDENQHSVFVKAYDEKGSSYGYASLVKISSTAGPSAFFTLRPEFGEITTIFHFDASGSYISGDGEYQPSVRWDWDYDGRWDTPYSEMLIREHQFSKPGIHRIRMEVRDRIGLVSQWESSVIVRVSNSPPTAIFAVNPPTGTTDTTFIFDAGESHDTEDPSDMLQVRWDWENDSIWDTDFQYAKTAKHQFLKAGTYIVKMEIQDSGYLQSSNSSQVTVKTNPVKPQVKEVQVKVPISDNLILIPGGTFNMGDLEGINPMALPVHSVEIDSFYISPFEVTHMEYIEFLNSVDASPEGILSGHEMINMLSGDLAIKYRNNFYFSGSKTAKSINCPMIEVTWWGAVEYCNWLSKEAGLKPVYLFKADGTVICDWAGRGYRLPTEAEWEFAARGGGREDRKWSGTNIESEVKNFAWYLENSNTQTHAVGQKSSNGLGLYDMTGNVWEWCWDPMGGYDSNNQINPVGADTSRNRVIRGGSWNYPVSVVLCSYRGYGSPSGSYSFLGFRVSRR